MTRSCKESLEQVLKVLHTSIIWSHLFYIIAAGIALYTKHYTIMVIAIFITIVSIKHHLDTTNKFWGHLDFITASVGAIFITIYALIVVWTQNIPVKGNKERLSLIILFLTITIFAGITYVLAHFKVKGITTDPIKGGIFGPIVTSPQTPDPDSEDCLILSHQINYVYYHTLWHIFSGLSGIIITIFIVNN